MYKSVVIIAKTTNYATNPARTVSRGTADCDTP